MRICIKNNVKKFLISKLLFSIFIFSISASIPITLYLLKGEEFFIINYDNVFTWICILFAFLPPIKLFMMFFRLLRYESPIKICFYSTYFEFITYKNWKSEAQYSDFLAIFYRTGQVGVSEPSKTNVSIIYYRDRKLKKVNLLIFEDSAFERVLQEYRKYLENSKDERRALVLYDIATLREMDYARTKGRLEEFMEKYRANRKLEEFE